MTTEYNIIHHYNSYNIYSTCSVCVRPDHTMYYVVQYHQSCVLHSKLHPAFKIYEN